MVRTGHAMAGQGLAQLHGVAGWSVEGGIDELHQLDARGPHRPIDALDDLLHLEQLVGRPPLDVGVLTVDAAEGAAPPALHADGDGLFLVGPHIQPAGELGAVGVVQRNPLAVLDARQISEGLAALDQTPVDMDEDLFPGTRHGQVGPHRIQHALGGQGGARAANDHRHVRDLADPLDHLADVGQVVHRLLVVAVVHVADGDADEAGTFGMDGPAQFHQWVLGKAQIDHLAWDPCASYGAGQLAQPDGQHWHGPLLAVGVHQQDFGHGERI